MAIRNIFDPFFIDNEIDDVVYYLSDIDNGLFYISDVLFYLYWEFNGSFTDTGRINLRVSPDTTEAFLKSSYEEADSDTMEAFLKSSYEEAY